MQSALTGNGLAYGAVIRLELIVVGGATVTFRIDMALYVT